MRPILLSWVAVTDWLAAGMSPPIAPSHVPPMGVVDSLVLVGVLVLTFWVSIRLAIWLDVKMSAHALFREIHRQLGVGRGPGAKSKRRR